MVRLYMNIQNRKDANSEWGTANFNLWLEEVRSFLMSAANFWVDVYHVDGLRMGCDQ